MRTLTCSTDTSVCTPRSPRSWLRPERVSGLLTLLTLLFLSTSTSAFAATDPALVTALTESRRPLHIENGSLAGPGADLLIAEGKKSQFFLIGEDHGGRETAAFAAALYAALRPAGYTHLAVEAGPITGERMEAMAASGGLAAIEAFDKSHPFTLPFFMWREEADYLALAVAANRGAAKRVIWGLDQEFATSEGFHFDRLAAVATTEEQKRLASEMKARSVAGYGRMVAEHNPTVSFMMTATPADFDALAAAFRGNAEATRVVAELRESADIYQAWMKRKGFESNEQRAVLMKRNFNRDYAEAVAAGEKTPRVMMKFGASHMIRGLSFSSVYDLGTYLPDLAIAHGQQTFQVLLIAPKGHINAYFPFSQNPTDREKPYHPSDDAPQLDATPLFEAAVPNEWTVIDLRPLRPKADALKVDPTLKRILFGFDAVVIIPEVHPSTLVE
jgi:hypothetical protein